MSTDIFISSDDLVKEINTYGFNSYADFLGPYLTEIGPSNNISFHCKSLFSARKQEVVWPPPKRDELSKELLFQYTMNYSLPMVDLYLKEEQQNGGGGYHWSKYEIDQIGSRPSNCGYYGSPDCEAIFRKYEAEAIVNKTGIVVGSQSPWAEGALIAAGATKITTIEYMKIQSGHPQLAAYHPDEIARQFMRDEFEPVDFAFSYSSVEHTGLGRYGDPLNPSGDLEEIAKIHCLLKPNGILFLAFPMGPDAVMWNAHRAYGPIRLKAILQMPWTLLEVYGKIYSTKLSETSPGSWMQQPFLVLRKDKKEHVTHHMTDTPVSLRKRAKI